jgi:hypothetical protein
MTLRTDLKITQLPSPLPNWGALTGKNTIQTDPDFGTKIVRLTDGMTCLGSSMQTADQPECGLWNANDTLLLVRNTGGSSVVIQFNPATLQGKQLTGKFDGNLCFSRTDPAVLYRLIGTKIAKLTFKTVGSVMSYTGTATPVCDFAGSLPAGFKVKWTSSFMVSADDTTFVAGFSEGQQNSGSNICVFQTGHAGGGYRMLDITKGQITGDWGITGACNMVSPHTTFPFVIHEAMQTANPQYAIVSPSPAHGAEGYPLVWDTATLNLTDMLGGGHAAKGYLHAYFGGPGGGQYLEVPYANIAATRMIVPRTGLPGQNGQKYCGDQHTGFGKFDPLDNATFWDTSQSQVTPFTSAWMNEVRGYNAQTGVVSRACHTFNSGNSPSFIVQNAIGVPSQTGSFVAFTSDAMGSLGMTVVKGKAVPRGDVFVVDVRNL